MPESMTRKDIRRPRFSFFRFKCQTAQSTTRLSPDSRTEFPPDISARSNKPKSLRETKSGVPRVIAASPFVTPYRSTPAPPSTTDSKKSNRLDVVHIGAFAITPGCPAYAARGFSNERVLARRARAPAKEQQRDRVEVWATEARAPRPPFWRGAGRARSSRQPNGRIHRARQPGKDRFHHDSSMSSPCRPT